jgi:hypothetical protein
MNSPLLDDLLNPLNCHFAKARVAYGQYSASGGRFKFAQELRRINLSARQLLVGKNHLLPDQWQADALALVAHYDKWLKLWTEHRSATKPRPDDIFTFENRHTYPKASEVRLERLREELLNPADGQ